MIKEIFVKLLKKRQAPDPLAEYQHAVSDIESAEKKIKAAQSRFARVIRRARKIKKRPMREVAQKAAISLGYYCDLENGRRPFSLKLAKKIKKALE